MEPDLASESPVSLALPLYHSNKTFFDGLVTKLDVPATRPMVIPSVHGVLGERPVLQSEITDLLDRSKSIGQFIIQGYAFFSG